MLNVVASYLNVLCSLEVLVLLDGWALVFSLRRCTSGWDVEGIDDWMLIKVVEGESKILVAGGLMLRYLRFQ